MIYNIVVTFIFLLSTLMLLPLFIFSFIAYALSLLTGRQPKNRSLKIMFKEFLEGGYI